MNGAVLEIKFSEEFGKELIEQLQNDPAYQPWCVGSRSEHAIPVEFGSHGFSGGKPSKGMTYRSQGKISPVEEDFRKWVEKKLHLSGKDRDIMARKIYRKVMNEGIAPNPFLRPAIHNVFNRVSSSDDGWMGMPKTTESLAILIEDEMRRILQENKITFTGDIADKLFHVPASEMEEGSAFLDSISDEVWESDTMDYTGDETRWKEMEQRGHRRPARD